MTKFCGTLESMITMEEQARGRGKSVCPVWSHVVGMGEKILYQVVGKVSALRVRIQKRYVSESCTYLGRFILCIVLSKARKQAGRQACAIPANVAAVRYPY